jgi:protease IV
MRTKRVIIIIFVILGIFIVISAIAAIFSQDLPLKDRVALIRVEGPIIESKNTVSQIKQYVKDNSVKALILRVDSPGGGVAPSQEIYDEVRKAAASKPVVVSMGALAASGGYYISAPATRIIANPGTMTGSIGVIMEVPNLKGFMDKLGVKTEVVKSGKHKDIVSVFRGIGDEERKILQGVMDNVHNQFIKAVSEGRHISFEDVRKIADGRVFSGEQAQALGLVDELGSLEYTIKVAAKMAGIDGEPEVVTKKERHAIMELLDGQIPDRISRQFMSFEFKYLYKP